MGEKSAWEVGHPWTRFRKLISLERDVQFWRTIFFILSPSNKSRMRPTLKPAAQFLPRHVTRAEWGVTETPFLSLDNSTTAGPIAFKLVRLEAGYYFTQVRVSVHVLTQFPYPGNCWEDCVEIARVGRDPIDTRITQERGGVHLHVRTCTSHCHISGTMMPSRPARLSPITAPYRCLSYKCVKQ